MHNSDFNEILHPYEKSGGNDRNLNLINDFREAMRDCDLMDVSYKGYPFTWSNGDLGKVLWKKGWIDLYVTKLRVIILLIVQQAT